MSLPFILTNAGKAAIVNAQNTGTAPVVISQVAIGSVSWTPTAAATALNTEIKRISAIGGGTVADDTIHVTASDSSADTYTIREVGLYTNGGVLLAIYSQADPILTKGATTVALLAADLVITGLPVGSVTVGDTTFDYPPATETRQGVAELATTAEAQAGTDDERILTPKKLQDVTATETRKGVVELATAAEVQAGADTSRAVTPAGLAARTATTSRTGVVELATDAEAQAGTDTERAVTPAALAAVQATETRRGLIEIATQTETDNGVSDVTAVTPAKLAARTATETRAGLIELATAAEVQGGTDAVRAVTPAGLAARTATDVRAGIVELATNAEAKAGTDTERAVTPAALKHALGGLVPVAWCYFDANRNVIAGQGVASVTSGGGNGQHYINFTASLGTAVYCVIGSVMQSASSEGAPDTCQVRPDTASRCYMETWAATGGRSTLEHNSIVVFALP